MALKDRQKIMKEIEKYRDGRALICFFNFDRPSDPPMNGLATQLDPNAKEPLYRILKKTVVSGQGFDLCLYTRGGDVNTVWPLVTTMREFDPDFEVLVPFRCHSGGTMICLGSKKVHMAPLGELSPIDPSTVNPFNPEDPITKGIRMAISVEDVQAYREFICEQFKIGEKPDQLKEVLLPFVEQLTTQVHPLALGNVQRVYLQIQQLAKKLLFLNGENEKELKEIIKSLTTDFYSHLHMIDRNEAKQILGDRIEASSDELTDLLDKLLRAYEDDFELRWPFYVSTYLGDDQSKDVRFIGGAIESSKWSYLWETEGVAEQFTQLPQGVQVQLQPGQTMPLVPGLPREYKIKVTKQGWSHNTSPMGVTE